MPHMLACLKHSAVLLPPRIFGWDKCVPSIIYTNLYSPTEAQKNIFFAQLIPPHAIITSNLGYRYIFLNICDLKRTQN